MALKITLSNDVADYLTKQSKVQNKPCDQIADEILRRVTSFANEPGTSEPTGECLNQTLDDLYVDDYFEKMRQ